MYNFCDISFLYGSRVMVRLMRSVCLSWTKQDNLYQKQMRFTHLFQVCAQQKGHQTTLLFSESKISKHQHHAATNPGLVNNIS